MNENNDEQNVNNNLEQNVVPTVQSEQPVVSATPQPVVPVETQVPVAPQPQPVVAEPTPSVEKPKKNNKMIIIIIAVLLIVGGALFVFFGTDLFKSNNEEPKPEEIQTDVASKFEGIYQNNESTLFVKKVSDTSFSYTLSGNGLFQGKTAVDKNTAKETTAFAEDIFTFTYKEDGSIEVNYESKENSEPAIDLGTYKKVAEYTKENVYKYEVGDASYLTNGFSGLYKNGEITMAVIQKTDTTYKVALFGDYDFGFPMFDEEFEKKDEKTLVAKSFFDEEEVAFELALGNKEISLKVNDQIFGADENDKQLELTYTFSSQLTIDQVLNEYYPYY